MKKRVPIVFITICFLICLFPLPAFASQGASARLGQPLMPGNGTLGYTNEAHEYIYAFKAEPDIQISFSARNQFDFGQYPPVPIFFGFSGVYANNTTDIDMQGLPYYKINDPFITANYAKQLANLKTKLTDTDVESIAILVFPQDLAESWNGTTQYFSFISHFGGGSELGFSDSTRRGTYAEAITAAAATSSQTGTYMLKEPTRGIEVTKKILDNGNPVDEKEVQVGEEVAYQITIKNTSEIWLEDLVLQDDLFGKDIANLQIDSTPATLESNNTLKLGNQKGTKSMMSGRGKDIVVTYTYTVTKADIVIQNGKAAIPNEAKINATTPKKSYDIEVDYSGAYPYVGTALFVVKPVSGKDDCLLTLGDAEPKLSIEKTVSPTTASVGDQVSYQIKVTNNSPFGVQNILVVDTLSPNAGDFINGQCVIDFLAADESKVLSYPYIAAAANVQNGQIINTATASLGDYTVSSSATLLISEQPSPSPLEAASHSQPPTPSYTASESPASTGNNRPGTGDTKDAWNYIILCILCLIAIGVLYYLLRRGKKH